MGTSRVLVGNMGKTVWIKMEGRGTFQNSGGIKDFTQQMINRGHREFVVDLRDCEMMDSTFMGTLAGIALRLREMGQGELRAVRANTRNRELLENLGLDRIIHVQAHLHEPAPASNDLEVKAGDGEDAAHETVLTAHEALVEADPANAIRFRDVLEFLRQDDGGDVN